ncbi:MAG TPA: DUF1080 domain-containing protein, partial [Gemmatimonadaceae bacterium]|nr:DUF1080 domain-containing protein [Gemmatimonadaceae bacterium]
SVPSATASSAAVSPGDSTAGWRSLFDGQTLAGWRGYKETSPPKGWAVKNGAIVREGEGGDLITDEAFGNFELALEWMISRGGNSGILYRVTEAGEKTYVSGPEMQVLDDEKHVDGKSPLTSAGALYGLYPAPRGALKPVGEWNAIRIVANGDHVEHWLNGVKMADAEIGSPDWNQRVAGTKFAVWPGYAKAARGHIALQDHGDWVAFRNIRIRVLP